MRRLFPRKVRLPHGYEIQDGPTGHYRCDEPHPEDFISRKRGDKKHLFIAPPRNDDETDLRLAMDIVYSNVLYALMEKGFSQNTHGFMHLSMETIDGGYKFEATVANRVVFKLALMCGERGLSYTALQTLNVRPKHIQWP